MYMKILSLHLIDVKKNFHASVSYGNFYVSRVDVFYRVDLCHQANDEDDEYEESSSQEALLDKTLNKPSSSKTDGHRKCFPLRFFHIGSHQKIVILVCPTVTNPFLLMKKDLVEYLLVRKIIYSTLLTHFLFTRLLF